MAGNKSAGGRLACRRNVFLPACMKTVLSAVLVFASWAAHAQGTGEMYAAPGMAVRLPGRVLLVPAHPERALVAKSPAIPVIFPRFWQLPDSVKHGVGQLFFRRINGTTKYPATTLRAQLEGTIFIRLIILPTGEVGKTEIAGRELKEQFADVANKELMNQARADLDAAALKSVQGLRFTPASATDSVTVPRTFIIQ